MAYLQGGDLFDAGQPVKINGGDAFDRVDHGKDDRKASLMRAVQGRFGGKLPFRFGTLMNPRLAADAPEQAGAWALAVGT